MPNALAVLAPRLFCPGTAGCRKVNRPGFDGGSPLRPISFPGAASGGSWSKTSSMKRSSVKRLPVSSLDGDGARESRRRSALCDSIMCEEYRPSRRRIAPFSPLGAFSYSATIASLYSGLNTRRDGRGAGSAAGVDGLGWSSEMVDTNTRISNPALGQEPRTSHEVSHAILAKRERSVPRGPLGLLRNHHETPHPGRDQRRRPGHQQHRHRRRPHQPDRRFFPRHELAQRRLAVGGDYHLIYSDDDIAGAPFPSSIHDGTGGRSCPSRITRCDRPRRGPGRLAGKHRSPVSGKGSGRISVAGLFCVHPDVNAEERARLLYRIKIHRKRKGERNSFAKTDYAALRLAIPRRGRHFPGCGRR